MLNGKVIGSCPLGGEIKLHLLCKLLVQFSYKSIVSSFWKVTLLIQDGVETQRLLQEEVL